MHGSSAAASGGLALPLTVLGYSAVGLTMGGSAAATSYVLGHGAKVYLKQGRIKCELALARGKKLHDKREAERAKTDEAEAREAIRARKARG